MAAVGTKTMNGTFPQSGSLGSALGRACPGLVHQLRPPPWDVLYREDLLKGQRSHGVQAPQAQAWQLAQALGFSVNPHFQLW